jgi:hypothetical protein
VTDEFRIALGRVTEKFALLELHVDVTIWTLLVGTSLQDQAKGRIVTAGLMFGKKLDMLAALLRVSVPNLDDAALSQLLKKLEELAAQRNHIVHSSWFSAEEEKMIAVKTTARRELKSDLRRFSVDDVNDLADRLHVGAEDVANLFLSLVDPNHRIRVRL